MKTFYEPFCGLAAVTNSFFGLTPPCSRQGCKTGYTEVIKRELLTNTDYAIDNFLLCDVDPWLVAAMNDLFHRPRQLGREIYDLALETEEPRDLWNICARERGASTAAWWLWCAGAFRGVGNWRGGHKNRPNASGFSPNPLELARRIRARPPLRQVAVICCNAMELEPHGNSWSYFDPPYFGTSRYSFDKPFQIHPLAMSWRDAGARVAVSEGMRLDWPGFRAVEITNERRGQDRKDSLSKREWLMVSV